MTNRADHVIEVEKLTKRYGDLLAVNDISFAVRKGEVFALLGPNGAGKTTTVEIIDTIRTPTSGKVSPLGMDGKDKTQEHYKTLSGGLQQRLGIAIALVNDPEVMFLDEPTTGLDPRARREVWDVLLGLKKKGTTVFLTTHYMEEAELLAGTGAIISKGTIVAMGSPGELIESNAKYLVLTLPFADGTAFEIVGKMGLEPVQCH